MALKILLNVRTWAFKKIHSALNIRNYGEVVLPLVTALG